MADEELDRNWKPNGRRPQSTIARTFSQELMDIFRIENSLTDLDQQVDQRRQVVDKNTQELASIEKRIREMEARLTGGGQHSRPALPKDAAAASAASTATADKDEKVQSSRPGTAGTARAAQSAPGSGFMPPTPGASEDGDHHERS
jgi:chromosome segregation ATPase